MAAVNVLHIAAASTAASAAALQWWAASVLDEARAAGDGGDWLADVMRSRVTVALLANLAAHVFLLLILGLKGIFLPLVVPPSSQQMILWSSWLVILCSLKMFQSLAKERLDQLNASPSATPSKYFRVYSALLLVLSTDILWMRLCVGFCSSCNSKLFWLLFFEPLGIAFETLQVIQLESFEL
ncbi:hypothetical protein PR202_ga25272 [Eleusine coracana subsp. coracana]|uniref:Uncharacterized protein n=1 Tax=Eleusine coracana subsp. coracana TaxID=191504 RepID=A0AAV5D8Y0_ELECO|nr:hypothetical protein PR202_ga25272 [Eleusine coracana subsp. coracana]